MEVYVKSIFRILQALEKCLDYESADSTLFSHEKLGISYTRWLHYLLMLQEAGYIQGVIVTPFVGGDVDVNIDHIAITLKGIEYLAENTAMARAFKAIKEVRGLL